MQSGISASAELQNAFKQFVSSNDQRALLADIQNEALVPVATIPCHSTTFSADLSQLQSHLSPTKAAYVLLKLEIGASDGYAAITFVPNAAPVRQKMLFAATRLTLVRELGIERFRQTIFATEKEELTAEGWAKHEAHEGMAAPLTEEETGLMGVKEAEAEESRGTSGRRGHVTEKMDVRTNEGVIEALGLLREEGCKGTLVQLKYTLPGEVLTLDSTHDGVAPNDVAGIISPDEPRYTFYSYPGEGLGLDIVFIYTCPSKSKIKERMIYSTGKSWTRVVAERDAGIKVTRTLEGTEPSELTSELTTTSHDAAPSSREGIENKAAGSGFARPKRPGRR